MAIAAQAIIQDCVNIAQDVASTRWGIDEVCRFFNWAQREVVVYRPDASQTRGNITIAAGYKQALPAGSTKLVDIHANASGGAIRLIDRETLDAVLRTWRTTSAAAPTGFMYDPRSPLVFEIYPPASGATTVEGTYCTLPTDITVATAGGTYTDVTGNLSLQDQFAGAVTDLILYRMFSKDAEFAGNAARAKAHSDSAANSLGVEIKGTLAIVPTTPGNQNHPGASQATE